MNRFCLRCGTKLIEKISDGQKRLACPSCGYVDYQNARPTATAIIENDKGQVLLGKRALNPYKNKWDMVGGFLEKEENFEQALEREIKEETNLDLVSAKYFGSFVGTYQNAADNFTDDNVGIFFLVKAKGEIKAGDDISQCQWFDWDNLSDDMVGFEDVLAAIEKKKKELGIN